MWCNTLVAQELRTRKWALAVFRILATFFYKQTQKTYQIFSHCITIWCDYIHITKKIVNKFVSIFTQYRNNVLEGVYVLTASILHFYLILQYF